MKRILSILLCFFLFYNVCFSQDTIKNKITGQHTVFTEFFGNSLFWYHIGYDYTLFLKSKHKLSFAFGCEYLPIYYKSSKDWSHTLCYSPHISYLFGKKHHLEIGVGFMYYTKYYRPAIRILAIPFQIGYRFQKPNGGFFWKIHIDAVQPIFYKRNYLDFLFPWGGVSFGYTFNKINKKCSKS